MDLLRRLRLWDYLLLILIGGFIYFTLSRIDQNLNYRWNWSIIPNYIIRFDEESERWVPNLLLQGFLTTVRLAIWGSLFALIFGLIIALGRISNVLLFRMLARTYTEVLRNVPPVVIVFIFYFFLSEQIIPLFGIEEWARSLEGTQETIVRILLGEPKLVPAVVSGILVLAMFESTFVAEIIRAGILSIPKGQWEAADSIGLTSLDRMRFVILPQAIQRVVPALANQFISLVKDSSIISLISIQELTYKTLELVSTTRAIFEAWITTAALYFVICFSFALLFAKLEKRMRTGLN